MAAKVTCTLDEETVRQIRRLAERSRKPQSVIVREAIAYYAAREEKLSPDERDRQLALLREYRARLPKRTAAEVERELADFSRRARRGVAARVRRVTVHLDTSLLIYVADEERWPVLAAAIADRKKGGPEGPAPVHAQAAGGLTGRAGPCSARCSRRSRLQAARRQAAGWPSARLGAPRCGGSP